MMSSFLRRYWGPLLLFLGGAALIAVAPYAVRDRSETPQLPPRKPPVNPYGASHTMPGVRQPRAVSAAASGLTDSDAVIGIVVHGKARAYAVQAMAHKPQDHLINDVVNGTPVTVTYNNLGRFIRVFVGTGSEPLDVKFGGSSGGAMILDVGGHQYNQRSTDPVDPDTPAKFPFETVSHELTYWKKWHDAHPDTDAVVSLPAPAPEPAGPPATSPRP